MNKDLTVGKPLPVLWRFSLPLFVSVIFQQFYQIADSVIAGKFAGENALAAVGASYPITMIFMAFAVGGNIGCSVVISRLFGEKSFSKLKTAITTTLISFVGAAIILTAAGLVLNGFLMRVVDTPKNIFADSALYLRIYTAGLLFLFITNACTGIFTSLGDSKTPLGLLACSSIFNVVLDYLFVSTFKLGVPGVAWATFITQGLSCVAAVIILVFRLRGIDAGGRAPIWSASIFGDIVRISVPSILQQSFISVGNLCVQGLVNECGSSVVAGYSAAKNLNTFTMTSFMTLANGISSFTSQNLGAKKEGRVTEGFRCGLLMAELIALPFFVAFFFFSRNLVGIFLNDDATVEALETGALFLRIVSPFYFFASLKIIADAVLRGSGAMFHFMTATLVDLILRVALSFVFYRFFGATGIWYSWPAGWVVACTMSFVFYKKGVWRPARRVRASVDK